MIFVFKYERKSGVSERLGQFEDAEMDAAQRTRFEAEIAARNEDPRPEIVVLSAASEENLRRSHARYFGDDAIRENLKRSTA